jgi:hypothetical protein
VAPDSGADPAVGQWITEIQARKLAADARLRAATGTRPGPESMTKEQIATTVTAISDLMQAPRCATTEDKAEIYPALKAGTRHSISASFWAVAGASTSARGRAQNGLFWNLPIGERSAARALKAAGLQAALEHALTCDNTHSIACFGAHSAYAELYRCVVVSRRAGPGLASGYGTDCGGGGRDSRAGVRDAAGR